MEDSYIIANFHTLCRLCLSKSTFTVSIFGAAPDDEANVALTSKIAECFELQVGLSHVFYLRKVSYCYVISKSLFLFVYR